VLVSNFWRDPDSFVVDPGSFTQDSLPLLTLPMLTCLLTYYHHYFVGFCCRREVDRISASASVSVSAPNVDKWALSVHFRFRPAAVGKFGGCRK